ncbi:LOW QUALITY PROTEIN: anaphase-promoting complex subunit 2-like [Micropterus salmoides]|uniref:anaphase-promoting complex subunit 2-like n=1 Tax=Micropterus salmoides TaxID=27706 RepID=UPI0018ED1720|nr:anaphase-promoting complex subunit 2-like [Micropterus salmoides]XP_038566174.1 LOW QUALITY PROTEIN: anaphase-promoting complex subunit 2-like [Micropterus salmoides]
MEEMVMDSESAETSGPASQLGVSDAWETVTAALMSPGCSVTEQDLSESLALLCSQGLGRLLGSWLLETLQMRLSSSVVPEFWSGLKQPENELEERGRAWVLLTAFQTLLGRLEPFLGGLERLGTWQDEGRGSLCGPGPKGLQERAFTIIRALLLFSPSPVLQERVLEFYSRTFSVYMNQVGEAEDGAEVPDGPERGVCRGCGVPTQQCWCQEALEQLQEFSHILSKLQLLEWVSSEAVTSILHRLIEQRMEQHCRGEYERSFLLEFQKWLELVLGWLSKVFASEADGDGLVSAPGVPSVQTGHATSSVLKQWRCHMHQFFCRIYVNMRIEELFSIIRDFPESKAAIEDLKFCLERTNQRQQLLTSLKSAFESRLLHPGVHTSDILTVYISAIKALRELDPSMVILQVACQPIRKYLRTREDTVRQIVAGLTGDAEGCTDLASELSRGDPVTLEMQDSDEEGNDPEDWTPDPTDAVPDKMGSKRRSSDIISLLVSIYGSKDIFIDEYRAVLADRLLHQLNYNTAREIRNVELLKLRFGESHMHYCEVMLKDMADSRRINSNIREEESRLSEEEQPPLSLSSIILSSEFWPPLKEEKLELPPLVCQAMEAYTHRYEKLKAMRTLSWKPHLGSVTLDVELEDRTLTNLTVSPIHAAIILHFQEKSSWTLEELSGKLGAPKELVHRKLALWQQHGVLREEAGGRYYVVETGSSKEKLERGVMLIDSDEERDSNTTTQSEQREEKLQLFWAYIQAMLTNLDSMTLERIHSMLRMFVATGPVVTEMDVNELEAFLQRKVREHQLIFSTGVYRLPKSN